MQLDEHESKRLLEAGGIATPAGQRVATATEAEHAAHSLGLPVYIKALVPETNRFARGGVLRVDSIQGIQAAFSNATTALGASHARVESAVDATEQWFVSLGLPPGAQWVTALVSTSGGTGIEARTDQIAQVAVDPLMGFRGFHAQNLATSAGLDSARAAALTLLLRQCFDILMANDLELLELNPVALVDDRAVALDARMVVDDYALFRQPTVPVSHRNADPIADRLRQLGIEYVPLGGAIGVVGLGAGLTMHIVDWIDQAGGSAAFFFDATVAAVRDWPAMFEGRVPNGFAAALAEGISLVRPTMDALLVNFTSGGTPVDGLCRGLDIALQEARWTGPIVVHVGGNAAYRAGEVLEAAGLERSETIGDAVRRITGLSTTPR